jgi:AraC-like DNA-binding protein
MAKRLPQGGFDVWHTRELHTDRFDLTLEEPICALSHKHSRPEATYFDMHYEVELGIVASGKMTRCYRDWQTILKPGDVWLCGIWEPHGFVIAEAPCEVAVLMISPEFLATSGPPSVDWLAPFTAASGDRPRVRREQRQAMLALGRRIMHITEQPTDRQPAWLRVWLFDMLMRLTEEWPGVKTATARPNEEVHQRLLPAVRRVFESRNHISEDDAAAACGMSRNIFCRHFRNLMGISFAQFALRHRLRGAARSIGASSAPLKAIAAEWGFTDVSHLHRCFVRAYEVTPGQYRQRSSRAG